MPKLQTTKHFLPLTDPKHPNFKSRYLVWYGGRGGSKSWQIAAGLIFRATQKKLRFLCCREFQNSINDSVLQLLGDTIHRLGVEDQFKITQNSIINTENGSEFSFKGLRHNVMSVKSFEGVDIVWIEEGQTVSEKSWGVLVPTIRKAGSQVIVSFNPDMEDDPTYRRFVTHPPKDSYVCKVNWGDNPWFTKELNDERLHLMEVDPEAYENVWGGGIWTRSDAQILAGKWIVEDFEPKKEWGDPIYGADWGFSQDPCVLSELYVFDNILYCYNEAVQIRLEMDDIKAFWEKEVPGSTRKKIPSDCSRPETISYLKKHGIPGVCAAPKWKGSVEDGITHLRKFNKIVIHPRCKNARNEAKLYRYKVDQRTDLVTRKIKDAHNHSIDSWRYALHKMIKKKGIDYAKFNKM